MVMLKRPFYLFVAIVFCVGLVTMCAGAERYQDRLFADNIMGDFDIESLENDLECNSYYLSGKQVTIAIPSSYEVITEDTKRSSFFTQDKLEGLKSTMKSSGDYLTAINSDFSRAITVNIQYSSVDLLSGFSDEEINTVYSLIERSYVNASVYKKDFVRNENDICIKLWVKYGTGPDAYESLKYGTIIDSQAIWISIIVYDDGPITEKDELLADYIWKLSNLYKHNE